MEQKMWHVAILFFIRDLYANPKSPLYEPPPPTRPPEFQIYWSKIPWRLWVVLVVFTVIMTLITYG
jgi:hypothetical protein